MGFEHIPVLFDETIEGLAIRPDGIYVDCTVGGGGHSKAIVERLRDGQLIAIDQDEEALQAAQINLYPWKDRITFVHSNFGALDQILDNLGIERIDGILMDIGVSSHQLDDRSRGFSYHDDAPLDMRMDQTGEMPTAADVVNTYSADALAQIFWDYGEERWGKRIAQFIVEERKRHLIRSTSELVEVIKKAVPKGARQQDKHPARRVFQALRIEVNHELDVLKQVLDSAVAHLNPQGRICVITFHSLEDRIVKNAFRAMAQGCTCPPNFPVCVCGRTKQIKLITRKPITARESELKENARSRSAKLRVAERITEG